MTTPRPVDPQERFASVPAESRHASRLRRRRRYVDRERDIKSDEREMQFEEEEL